MEEAREDRQGLPSAKVMPRLCQDQILILARLFHLEITAQQA